MQKRFHKNLSLIAGIEGVIIIIMVFIGIMAYRLELERERDGYETFMRDVMDWEYDENEPETEPDIYRIYDTLNTARYGKQYGVAMKLMNVYGDVISQTEITNQILIWQPYMGGEDELIQLDLYFSEEDLDRMISYYYGFENSEGQAEQMMEIQKMQGYFDDNGKFAPVKIIFGEKRKHNITYSLTNRQAKESIDRDRLCWRYNAVGYREGLEAYGKITPSFNQTKRIFNKKAYEKIDVMDKNYMRGANIRSGVDTYETPLRILNGRSEIQSYRVSFYADLDYLTLHSYNFHKDVFMIVLFCQLAGIVIIACVLITNNRRFRLQQMRNTFINAMAHEMKTPAAVVKSGAECIREGIHPEKQAHYIELIEREADHMSDLLNDMLVYTKVADAGYHLKKEHVNMSDICQEVWEHYQNNIKEKQIIFEIDKKASFCLKGDPHLLEMVVDNFFSNAVRHCPPGKIIRLGICQNSLSVFNTGAYIPDVETDQIWEPLYQVDAARSGDNSSSGMGLAISAQILKLHHMKYGVRNVQDGVEFYIGL